MLVPAGIMNSGCTIVCNENTNSLRIDPCTRHDENNYINDEELHKVNNLLKGTSHTKITNCSLQDSDYNSNDDLSDLANQLPSVIQCLKEAQKFEDIKKFLLLVAQNRFPMQNIAFKLFLDLVRWLSVEHSNLMRFSPVSLHFWRTGRCIPKRKFIRMMSGPKLEGR